MSTRRKLLSALLIMVLALVCVVAVSCKAPEGPQKTEWPEAGVYYFDAVTDEYTLTLNVGDTFSLYVKGESLSGAYTLTDKNLVLDFDKDGKENATATYDGSVITLNYEGSSMRMLKKISYSVSFNTNDGSAVAAQTVLNGKAAVKPADPTRENYVFVGWYVDADFKTPYAFGAQPITADTTLFAQWAPKTVENREYTAKLDTNYGGEIFAEVLTSGGQLFDLPIPERTGFTFGGWWFSNDNDGEKLSYKYESGMTLSGDVTLYALWQQNAEGTKLLAPIVNVTPGAVSWNAVAGARSYLLKVINAEGESIIDTTVSATTYNVPFASYEAGNYTVIVTALAQSGDANNSESVRYYANKALNKVSGFSVIGDMLIFNTVEGAEKYLITVVCGNPEHDHKNFDNGDSRTFNFANCAMTGDGISFTVTAVAEGYASSVSEVFTYKRELGAIEGLRFDAATETLYWNEVVGAESYMVSVKCGNEAHNHNYVNFGTQTYVSLKECAALEGGIVVKVYPKTAGFISSEPVQYVFNKTALTAPGGLFILGTTLNWAEVAGADGYEVMVNGSIFEAEGTSFDLSSVLSAVDGDVCNISVRAIAENPSAWSDALSAVYFEMGAATYNRGTLSWAPVIGADYYEVSVNGAAAVKVENAFSSAITLTKAGNNSIKVRFVDGSYKSEWTELTVFAHSVIFDSIGGSFANTQYLAVGDPITLPEPTKAGYEFVDWYNLPGGAKDNGLVYNDEIFAESGSIVLYAYYSANEYEITYNYGLGGVGDMATDKVFFGQHFQLTVPTASDVAGAFGGWFSAPYGMGIRYTDEYGNSVNPWAHLEGAELYAYWIDKALDFTLTKVNGKDVYAVKKGERIHLVDEVTVPATYKGLPVAFVAGDAFKNCANLKVINLPATIEQISGISPFAGCSSLTEINVYAVDGVAAPTFASVDGVLFANDANGNVNALQLIPAGKTGTYRIPDGISEIPREAFKGSMISKVVIPTSVVAIGVEAFDACPNLASVVFEATAAGQNENPLVISARAFRDCTSLERINLPSRLTEIKLQKYAIYDGEISTTDVEYAFIGCYNLAEINVAANSRLYKSVNGVLYTKDGRTLVLAPESLEGDFVVPNGTQSIAPGAFIGCKGLESVTLPGTMTLVGEAAFYNNNGLTKLVLSDSYNDLTIGNSAFANCSRLAELAASADSRLAVISDYAFMGTAFTEFTFPKTVGYVGVGAFLACEDLETVVFAQSTKALEFGADAFKDCSSLERVEIPANVSKIPGIFSGCSSLTEVVVDPASPYFETVEGVVYDKAVTYIVFFPQGKSGNYAIPATVTSIPNGVFAGANALETLTIPASVTYIGEGAFYEASIDAIEFSGEAADGAELVIDARAFDNAELGSLTIPAHAVSLGSHAFFHAEIDNLTIEEGLKVIENNAFEEALVEVVIPASVEYIGAYAFTGYSDWYDGDFFPEVTLTVDGSKLEYIGDYAFYENYYVEDVIIPASVKTIGNYAFFGCEELSSITFAENSVLKTIGAYAFSADSAWYIGSYYEIVIPKTVTEIGAGAFRYSKLKTVTFEDGGTEDLVLGTTVVVNGYYGIEYQSGMVFDNCDYLETVVLPTRLTVLGARTFYSAGYSSGNIEITFAEGETRLTTIGDECFASARISSFVVPASVRNLDPVLDPVSGLMTDRLGIGYKAFATTRLNTITFEEGTAPLTLGENAFDGAGISTIELPARLATYTSHTGDVISALANGPRVFNSCSSLTEITVEDADNASLVAYEGVLMTADMTEIIFCPESKEGTFEIPSTVTKIHDRAFYRCTKLTAITFAPGTAPMTIGDSAFANCELVTEFAIPDRVVSLGQTLFYGCEELVTLTLPRGIRSFDASMITYCSKLAAINVGEDGLGTFYASVDGVLYNATKTELVFYPNAKEATELVVDANVKIILSNAFADNEILEKIILPEGLVEIRDRAFSGCDALTEINIPSTVQLIGNSAFYSCGDLAIVNFSSEGDDPLIISDYAFYYNYDLEVVMLPARLYNIGSHAFYSSGVKTVVFAEGSKLAAIGESAFEETSLEIIVIPSVTEIGARAFYAATALKSVVIGEGLVSIGDNAFAGCTELVSVAFPASLKTLGAAIFYLDDWDQATCPKLEKVTFAKGSQLEFIPAGTFAYTALKSFVVPASVTGIGDGEYYDSENPGAFEKTPLTEITFERGSLCDKIGIAAFYDCAELEYVEIPTSVATIGEYAFASCESLESIVIPETVVNLGRNMFTNCYALSEVELETKATELPAEMFVGCSSLEHIVIPAGVKVIGLSCFAGTAISAFEVDPGNAAFKAFSGILYNGEGTEIVAFPPAADSLTTIVIPNTVTKLGDGLFAGMNKLESVIFEEGRTGELVIGNDTFSGCVALSSIELPEGTVSIGEYAFEDCSSLYFFTVPSTVKVIGDYAFYDCNVLEVFNKSTIEIGTDWGDLGDNALNIYTPTEGRSIVTVTDDGFVLCDFTDDPDYECVILYTYVGDAVDIVIPESVGYIYDYAFRYRSDLLSVIFPEGVAEKGIGYGAFSGCSNLIAFVVNDESFIDYSYLKSGTKAVYFGFSGEEYTYSFNVDGIDSVTSDMPITLPSPTLAGHYFGGWFLNAELTGDSYAAGSTYYGGKDTTLYAKWLTQAEYDALFAGTAPEYGILIGANESIETEISVKEKVWFKIEVSESGTYAIYTSPVSGDDDTMAYLYENPNGSSIKSADANERDGGWDHFYFEYDLEAGKTYYIQVYYYSSYSGVITFNVQSV